MVDTLTKVRELVATGRVRVSQHGMQVISDDKIDLHDVAIGVENARVVEDYPYYHKGPSVLCLQRDEGGEPIHVLWGLAAKTPDIATIITAYRPDPERWMTDWITRRPR